MLNVTLQTQHDRVAPIGQHRGVTLGFGCDVRDSMNTVLTIYQNKLPTRAAIRLSTQGGVRPLCQVVLGGNETPTGTPCGGPADVLGQRSCAGPARLGCWDVEYEHARHARATRGLALAPGVVTDFFQLRAAGTSFQLLLRRFPAKTDRGFGRRWDDKERNPYGHGYLFSGRQR